MSDAEGIAHRFLGRAGLPSRNPSRAIREEGGVGSWDLTYSWPGGGASVMVTDDRDTVFAFTNYREEDREMRRAPARPRTIRSEADAENALLKLWGDLGYRYRYELQGFRYSPDVTVPRAKLGELSGAFEMKFGKYFFVDRRAAVFVKLDPQNGEPLEVNSCPIPPPTGLAQVVLNRRQAFNLLNQRGRSFIEDWHATLGWYLPPEKRTAELGWRFQLRPFSDWYIVNGVSGRILAARHGSVREIRP